METKPLDSFKGESSSVFSHVEHYTEIFKTACLLCDVGHAPFSHTCEMFYLERGEIKKTLEFANGILLEKADNERWI